MEGFIMKKGRSESIIGRKNWKKRWFILDKYVLTYYEKFDTKNDKPINKKGEYNVEGCTIEFSTRTDKKFIFDIIHPVMKKLSLQGFNDTHMHMWAQAIQDASIGKFGRDSKRYDEHYEVLGFRPEDDPSSSELNRAYRKLALKIHPDKGGSISEFKKLQDALNTLLTKLEEEEKSKQFFTILFDVTIKKGPPGIGFGMTVIEDSKTNTVNVKTVLPSIEVINIDNVQLQRSPNDSDEECQAFELPVIDKLLSGDHLVMIGRDDVTQWSLARIIQRLNEFRVPQGSNITMRFSRKYRKDGLDIVEEAFNEEEYYKRKEEEAASPRLFSQPEEGDLAGNIEDTSAEEGVFVTEDTEQIEDVDEEDDVEVDDITSTYTVSPKPIKFTPLRRKSVKTGQIPSFPYIFNDSLKERVISEFLEFEKNSKNTDEYNRVVSENALLKKELVESRQREKYLELQLQQAILQNQADSTLVMQSMKDMIKTSSYIQMGQTPPVSAEARPYIEAVINTLNSQYPNNDKLLAARRLAILAVASIDPTRTMIEKWSLSGSSVSEKLSKLEERLAKIDANSSQVMSQ